MLTCNAPVSMFATFERSVLGTVMDVRKGARLLSGCYYFLG